MSAIYPSFALLLIWYRYNSALFTTYANHDVLFVPVAEAFTTGAWWNETRMSLGSQFENDVDLIRYLQQEAVAGRLQRLSNRDCLEAYAPATASLDATYGNVLLVTSSLLNDTVVNSSQHDGGALFARMPFLCHGSERYSILEETGMMNSPANVSCTDRSSVIDNASSWTPEVQQCQVVPYPLYGETFYQIEEPCPTMNIPIIYCLAEPYTQRCTARVETRFLAIVMACNALKSLVMLVVVFGAFKPLATIGDAIASLLAHSDVTTGIRGPLTATMVRNLSRGSKVGFPEGMPYERKSLRWRHAASRRFYACLVM